MEIPKDYADKKVLILGLGINQGGVGSTKFFAEQGANVRVTDLKTETELQPSLEQLSSYSNISYRLGGHDFSDIDWADLVIRNPALGFDNKYRVYAEQNRVVETDMGIFLRYVDASRIVGVTGTKGKSTTASLIHATLKNSGRETLLAGNIGRSVLETLSQLTSETLLVLELSSFQLEAWNKHQVSPRFGVITNILPDHLNYYGSMERYIAAKRAIAANQKPADYLFINHNDPITTDPEFLAHLEGQVVFFSPDDLPERFQPTLPGTHNRYNYAAALAVAKALGLDSQSILENMNKFQGVEFRQQLVKMWKGAKIINDTAATSPQAVIEALKTYPHCILITGGMDKDLPYHLMALEIDISAKAVYFIQGTATDKLKDLMEQKSKIKGEYDNFEVLLEDLKPTLTEGDTVILSPGATSFNFWQNEFDRGRKFNEAVEKVFI